MQTALAATQDTVRKESLLTVPTLAEMLDAGMTNPTVMTVHELAPIVIVGCTHLRNYIPYIHTFLQKCEDLPRDSKHRWIVPVEDCYSIKEFFENKCNRTPQAVYEQIRKYEKAKQERLTGTVAAPKTKKKAKPSVRKTNDQILAESKVRELEAKVKEMNADKRSFNNSYLKAVDLAEDLQEENELNAEVLEMTVELTTLVLRDCNGVTGTCSVEAVKEIYALATAIAAKTAVKHEGKHIPYTDSSGTAVPTAPKPTRKSAEQTAAESEAVLKNEPSQAKESAKPTPTLIVDGEKVVGHMYSDNAKGTAPTLELVKPKQGDIPLTIVEGPGRRMGQYTLLKPTVASNGSPMTCRTDLAVPSDFFAQALENTPWQTEPGIMGKAALRKTALWGAPYDYLGVQSNQPIDGPLPEFLAKLKKINDDALGVVTDSVLLNLYQDGRAGINAHSDWGHPGIIG
jgi:hypothetical protein